MKTIRRLVISLDGTWNNRDDSTNVLANHSLAVQCHNREQDGIRVTQERHYQEGVGTGPLDRITGGGFGFGLEDHVREAYDWLVQSYQDGDGTEEQPPDEIYLFGFSRGAYTARSLVGFLSMCGLLRRGAPLTVNQLWENYCILGLEREERSGGLAGKVFGRPAPKFRRITDLVWDPWYVDGSRPPRHGEVPGQRDGVVLNSTEQLLVRWSRRVKITYLGVYDTVGAMGWDALAIPGLRSKLALHHNMRPTTIIQKCRHALAIDEHRSSFAHTPFVAYIGEKTGAGEMERGGGPPGSAEAGGVSTDGPARMRPEKWARVVQMWRERIEQRWFVGAHSNIGGGYPDNLLAQRPLAWVLAGAREAGLICEPLLATAPVLPATTRPRDSFAEFVAPLWELSFRAKRNYRIIAPEPELRANHDEASNKGEIRGGFSLVTIHETVDDSALEYWRGSRCAPPNLIEALPRLRQAGVGAGGVAAELARKKSLNPWPGDGFAAQLALVLWASLAAAGLAVVDRVFWVWPTSSASVWLLCLLAWLFPLVDWAESVTNSFLARHGVTPWRRAFLDSIYWTRSIGVVLSAFGAAGALFWCWRTGWNADGPEAAARSAWMGLKVAGQITLCATGGAVVANVFNHSFFPRPWARMLGLAAGPLVAAGLLAGVLLVAQGSGHVLKSALGLPPAEAGRGAADATAGPGGEPLVLALGLRGASLLLLLQLAFAYFTRAFLWVGEPLRKANLGSITRLQWQWRPAGVTRCLDRWCEMLGDHHDEEAAERGMRTLVRQALWRDAIGFTPVYAAVLLFGCWYAATQLRWNERWTILDTLWFAIPLAAAAADYLEGLCHFHYLKLHAAGRHPGPLLTLGAFSLTVVKTAAFTAAVVWVASGIRCATGQIAWTPKPYGWRGLLALLASTGAVASVGGLAIWSGIYKLLNRAQRG